MTRPNLDCSTAMYLYAIISLGLWLSMEFLPGQAISSECVLAVGASGGTGSRVLRGLLDSGIKRDHIRLLTRNANKQTVKDLKQAGFQVFQGDLDDPSSLAGLTVGCIGCYVHSTASDTARLDKGEMQRARTLADVILSQNNIKHVIYHSAAAKPGHGNDRIGQKHDAEAIFRDRFQGTNVRFTALRANLFMEELWKKYTRPKILDGIFPFAIPHDHKIYLTSVRDLGRIAGRCLRTTETSSGRIINVAGDYLSPVEMAAEFEKAQKSPCRHTQARVLALLARLVFRSLWQEIRHFRNTTETTDIAALRKEFPGMITSFAKFLEETEWGDRNRTFADLQKLGKMPLLA